MLVVVSPAKKLDMDPVAGVQPTQPVFREHTREVVAVVAKLTRGELEKLMKISPNLAKLNQQRFSDFGSINIANRKLIVVYFFIKLN